MRNASITSWEAARQNNLPAAAFDRILGTSGITILPLAPQRISPLDALVDFVAREQLTRWSPGTQEGFAMLRTQRPETDFYYTGRDIDRDFYFGEPFAELFRGIRGLDVGCLTDQVGASHTEHYRRFGAKMLGIDIMLPRSRPEHGLYREDVRDLSGSLFRHTRFKFITVSAVFGEACPSDSILEIAAGLSEINRVLDEDGLAFFAQAYPEPAVWYTALQLGFRVFYPESRKIPRGWFLVKGRHPLRQNHFYPLIQRFEKAEFECHVLAESLAA